MNLWRRLAAYFEYKPELRIYRSEFVTCLHVEYGDEFAEQTANMAILAESDYWYVKYASELSEEPISEGSSLLQASSLPKDTIRKMVASAMPPLEVGFMIGIKINAVDESPDECSATAAARYFIDKGASADALLLRMQDTIGAYWVISKVREKEWISKLMGLYPFPLKEKVRGWWTLTIIEPSMFDFTK